MRLQERDFDSMLLGACDRHLASVLAATKVLMSGVELVATIKQTARHLLGSAGAFGHNWGHKLPLSCPAITEDGLHFGGPFGPVLFARLKAEYGPIWADVDFDKLSTDYFTWRAPKSVAQLGGGIVGAGGTVDVDLLWHLPEQLDCLWAAQHLDREQVWCLHEFFSSLAGYLVRGCAAHDFHKIRQVCTLCQRVLHAYEFVFRQKLW
jgi:hypothetical protein